VESRQAQIASFVRLKGYTQLAELADLAGVSELTIRRDLKILKARRLLNLVPGGATSDPVGASLIHFKNEVRFQQDQKRAIAREASALVKDGDTVLLDGGTTTWFVAIALRGKKIRVVTNSLPAADILGHEETVRLVMLGGTLYPVTGVTLGPTCIEQLRSLRPSVAFVGVGGLNSEGFTNTNDDQVAVERAMMELPGRCMVVADSSKFDTRDLVHLAALDAADAIITDSGITSAQREYVTKRGVKLIVAKPETRRG